VMHATKRRARALQPRRHIPHAWCECR
jgi:hypothetical protein